MSVAALLKTRDQREREFAARIQEGVGPARVTIKPEADRDPEFGRWITGVIGAEKIRQCIQCGACSGNCPLEAYMDYTPRKLIHMAKEGYKRDVLGSFTIWLCTSCYACTVECPRGIKVTDIIYALKRRAIDEGLYPERFPIPVLAREFRKMVRKHGRISEARLVTNLLLKTDPRRLLGMAKLGFKLIRTGRFSLRGESIRDRAGLVTILDAVEHGART